MQIVNKRNNFQREIFTFSGPDWETNEIVSDIKSRGTTGRVGRWTNDIGRTMQNKIGAFKVTVSDLIC